MNPKSAIAKRRNCLKCGEEITSPLRKYCEKKECQIARTTISRKNFLAKHGHTYISSKMQEWRHSTGRTMAKGGSIAEEIVLKKLKEKFGDMEIIRRTRSLITNPETGYKLELDFYIPTLNLAIEVDGATHRTECYGKKRLDYQKRNDYIKEIECKKNHITLIRVPFGRDVNVFCDIAIVPISYLKKLTNVN